VANTYKAVSGQILNAYQVLCELIGQLVMPITKIHTGANNVDSGPVNGANPFATQHPIDAPVVGGASAANTSNVATLTAAVGATTLIRGFTVSGLGATSAAPVNVVVTDGTWTLTFVLNVPAGVTVVIAPFTVVFGDGLPASATHTNITVTVAAFGSGNTSATVNAWGVNRTPVA
jgi:hypothetical protein